MDQPPPTLEAPPAPPSPPPHTTLAARLLNVFAVPSEVFDEIKVSGKSVSNWLVPLLLLCLAGVVSATVMFSQPSILQEVRDAQSKAIEEKVKAGKLTEQQAKQADDILDKYMTRNVLRALGAVGAVGVNTFRLFWWGLVLMLFGRWFFNAEFGYGKALEAAGLAMMIAVLGNIVTLLMIVNLAHLSATPSLALVVQDFDFARKSHLMMAAVNVFSLWQVIVLSIALARFTGAPFLRAAAILWIFFFMQECFLIIAGMGQFAL